MVDLAALLPAREIPAVFTVLRADIGDGFFDISVQLPGEYRLLLGGGQADRRSRTAGGGRVRVARDQPPDVGDVELIELGRALGLDAPGFAESIRGGKYLPWPGNVTDCAAARGVTTVPRMFVQGVPIAPQLGPILTAIRAAVG